MKTACEVNRPNEGRFQALRMLGETGAGFALLNSLRVGIPRFGGAPVQVRLGNVIAPLGWLIYDPISYPQRKGIKSCKYLS
jgi:hypothetical protein